MKSGVEYCDRTSQYQTYTLLCTGAVWKKQNEIALALSNIQPIPKISKKNIQKYDLVGNWTRNPPSVWDALPIALRGQGTEIPLSVKNYLNNLMRYNT